MNSAKRFLYFNISLIAILFGIISTFLFLTIKNKENQKNYWALRIGVSEELDKNFQIKIIDFELKNKLDNSYYSISEDYNFMVSENLLIDNQFGDLDLKKNESESLFPDKLHLSYYSTQEKKKYEYQGDFPYDKLIEKFNKQRSIATNFNIILVSIKTKGEIELQLTDYNSEQKILIEKIISKEVN